MSRKEKPMIDPTQVDEMLPEYDLSRAVNGYTAFRIGEDSGDEDSVEKFWIGLGFEVERIIEPARRYSKAPDFLLQRQGISVAVCEVKSMADFDYTIRENHEDGTATETRHNWRESNLERVLHLFDRARNQLLYWNEDSSLVNLFVFVNHDRHVRCEDVADAIREMKGIDATFWFEVAENGAMNSNASVIASHEGQRRLKRQLGLSLNANQALTSAA